MNQPLDQFKKLTITARLSLFVAALLLVTIGITVNSALTRQEKRTRAASNLPTASTSSIIINPDKTLSINGKKTFPQIFYSICSGTYATGAQCTTNLQRMSIYDADISGPASMTIPQHEQEGMGYINMVSSGTGYKDSPNFFGYMQVDEPIATGQDIPALEQAYRNIKADDPNHVVIATDWTRLNEMRNMADIIMDDGYIYSDAQWLKDIGYTRQTALYFKESMLRNSAEALDGVNDFDGISKPVYSVIAALSVPDSVGVQPLTKPELRTSIFLAVTMNMKGLAYFAYNENSLEDHYGLVRDQTMVQQYIDQAAEIKALNDILVLPTKDYRWQHRPGTQVSFSKVLTINDSIYVDGYTNFNYMLKQDGSVHYLIVLNKDSRSISDVGITVAGLNGPMTAKKIIGSSTTANQDAPVNNGVFTDSFDGLAVHVYQIYSGSNPPAFPTPDTTTPGQSTPTPTPASTPSPTPPYVTPTLYCLGLGINSCMTLAIQTPIPSTTQNISGPTPTQTPIKNTPIIGGASLLILLISGIIIYYKKTLHESKI